MVRHILGFLLGIVLTPAMAYAVGWGAARSESAVDPLADTITDTKRLYGAFALMAAAGLVTGVVIVARWASPMVSLVPALAFIGWSVWFLLATRTALDLPGKVPPAGDLDEGLRTMLGTGVFALAGFALLTPAWTGWRWGGTARVGEPVEESYY
ncbi:MAG TPA: hypothetical protein VFU43_24455 [Streptosporangiaceae bacterium]|nr:hypothetical protein [Streptosporangiaceae bacterium]